MANRHLSRSLALQILFEWDFNGYHLEKIDESVRQVTEEFGPGIEETTFVEALVLGVIKHHAKLDHIIEKAAPDWPIPQIAIVDRNVLRIGLFELLFGDKKEVPARVAINEAIELAKTFGGENSGRFTNGVLGTIYKEMGEPGKDEIPAKKKRHLDIPFEEMPIEKLGGAVVYHRSGDKIELALVHDVFGYWTLSKGHIEEGEDLKIGSAREIKEELNLEVEIGEALGQNEYIATHPEKGKIRKQVNYFLAEAKSKAGLKLEAKGGLDNADWFELAEVPDLRMYDDVIPFVTKAITSLKHQA
jgi:N utilization substance protein B